MIGQMVMGAERDVVRLELGQILKFGHPFDRSFSLRSFPGLEA